MRHEKNLYFLEQFQIFHSSFTDVFSVSKIWMKVINFEVKFIVKKALSDRSVATSLSFLEIRPVITDF